MVLIVRRFLLELTIGVICRGDFLTGVGEVYIRSNKSSSKLNRLLIHSHVAVPKN